MHPDANRESLFAALDETWDDRTAQAALADWFEEQGDDSASRCLRWVVTHRRRPGHNLEQKTYGKFFWERKESSPILDDPQAQLPESLWDALAGNDEPHPVGSFKSYPSPRAAYLALIVAWSKVGIVEP